MMKYLITVLFILIAFTTQAQNQEWKTIKTFSGSGISNTAPFTVDSKEWKVVYESKATHNGMDGAGHILQIYLLKPGQELWEGEIIANEVNKINISGESYVYESGRFYFKSNSANGEWKIKVMILND